MADPFSGLPKPKLAEPVEEDGADPFASLRQAYQVQQAQRPEETTELTSTGQALDVAKGFGSGLGRGVVAIPGLLGDVGQLGSYAPALGSYAYERAREVLGYAPRGTAEETYQKKAEEARSGMSEAEKSGKYGKLFGYELPTGQYFVEKAQPYIPGLTFEPRTGAGRVAGTVGEFLGSSLTTRGLGGIKGGASGVKQAVTSMPAAATDIGAGVGSGIAGEAFRGTPDEFMGRLVGAVPGALAGRGAYGRLSQTAAAERGERLAGDVLRKQIQDETAAKTALGAPQGYVPGVKPTTPQVLRSESGISGLESELRAGETPGSIATRIGMEQSQDSLAQATQRAVSDIESRLPYQSMADAFNLPVGGNPRAIASGEAQNLFRAVEEPLLQASEKAWKHPAFENAFYKKDAIVGSIDQAIKDMGISRLALPKEMKDYISELKKYKGAEVPFDQIQKIKSLANQIARDPSVRDRSGAIQLTTKLDDLLTDPKNLSPKYPLGADAPQAFENARTATREYKKLFSTEDVGPLAERYPKGATQAGQYVTQPEQMLDRIFGNPQTALARYRELQKIPGMDISRPASDWMIAKLTNNGEKATITQGDVAKFLRDPGTSSLVNEIPGLQQRIDQILTQSVGEQVRNSFAAALDSRDVTKLSQYINKNRALVDQVFSTPQQQAFIDALERSSKILEKVPGGTVIDRNVLDRLMKGDLFTILHGKVTGKLGEMTAGVGAGKIIGLTAPVAAGLETLTAGAISSGFFPKAQTLLSNIVYGTTREQAIAALNRAMREPAYMNLLMSKPTIENSMRLWNSLIPFAAKQAGTRGVLGSRDLTPQQPEETTEQAYDRLSREGRIGRKAGGRISAESHAADLMRRAEIAKKNIGKHTEALLNKPDETVVKALQIANQNLEG